MTTQHTPGPWRVTAAKVMAGNGRAICLIENRKLHEGFQESSANARLAAAAPELLDTLQRFVTACDAHLPEPTHQAFCGLFASAREAIAKATGAA